MLLGFASNGVYTFVLTLYCGEARTCRKVGAVDLKVDVTSFRAKLARLPLISAVGFCRGEEGRFRKVVFGIGSLEVRDASPVLGQEMKTKGCNEIRWYSVITL
jgi:hypothetical protein